MRTNLSLRESQQLALSRLCEPGRTFAALWAEPRSGKTAVCLKWAEHVDPGVVVIVAPKIAEVTWRTEAEKWLGVDYKFFPLTSGNNYPSLEEISVSSLTLLFVNYEQFGTQPFKRLKPFLKDVSSRFGRGAMILDESHSIKSPSSVIGRNIRPLAKDWKYRLLVTGTPVTNPSQIDAIYGQWTFLDPSIRDKWSSARNFREHFGEWSTVKGFPELVRPRNQWELNNYLQPNVVTMTGDSRKLRKVKASYTLPPTVSDLCDRMLKDGVVAYKNNHLIGLNPLTRLLRLRQMVAGWCISDTGEPVPIEEAAEARLYILSKILDKTKGKVIVCCTHLREVSLVENMLQEEGVKYLTITGAVPNKDRVIERFQDVESIKVLVVQPRTVSMAVDISVANDLVWYTSDFNYVTFKQTSDRIKLSPANPTVWFICAKDSVDEDVWTTLEVDHSHLKKVMDRIK